MIEPALELTSKNSQLFFPQTKVDDTSQRKGFSQSKWEELKLEILTLARLEPRTSTAQGIISIGKVGYIF